MSRSEIFVGETLDGMPVAISDHSRTQQVQIVAATGRGKTESVVVPWMIQDIIRGRPTLLIDAKGDQSILNRVRRVYEVHALPSNELFWFDLSDPDKSHKTNPLKYGSSQQITDRLFSTFVFENTYYKSVSYEAALLVVELIKERAKNEANGESVTFERIYDALTNDECFTALVTNCDEKLAKRALKFLAEPKGLGMKNFLGLFRSSTLLQRASLPICLTAMIFRYPNSSTRS